MLVATIDFARPTKKLTKKQREKFADALSGLAADILKGATFYGQHLAIVIEVTDE